MPKPNRKPVPPGEFTFEQQDPDGTKHPVEFTPGSEQAMADFIASTFGGMGITGIVWADDHEHTWGPWDYSTDPEGSRACTECGAVEHD